MEEIEDEESPSRIIPSPPVNPNRILEEVSESDNENVLPGPKTSGPSKKRRRVLSDDEDDGESTAKAQKKAAPAKRAKAVAAPEVIEVEDEKSGQEKLGEHYWFIRLLDTMRRRQIDTLAATWTSPIYAFFAPSPVYKKGLIRGVSREWHEFTCAAVHCASKGSLGRKVRRYIDTKDEKSTSNLKGHAENCWGKEIVSKAIAANLDVGSTRESLEGARLKDGSLEAVFKRVDGKAPVTFSHRQHTYKETR